MAQRLLDPGDGGEGRPLHRAPGGPAPRPAPGPRLARAELLLQPEVVDVHLLLLVCTQHTLNTGQPESVKKGGDVRNSAIIINS